MYTALVLDKESHDLLKSRIKNIISPKYLSWRVYCHHMTINMGKASEGPEAYNLNKPAKSTVVGLGVGEKVIAVKVESDTKSKNEIKHITVAVDTKNGGKPFLSNQITDWKEIEPFELTGTIQECD